MAAGRTDISILHWNISVLMKIRDHWINVMKVLNFQNTFHDDFLCIFSCFCVLLFSFLDLFFYISWPNYRIIFHGKLWRPLPVTAYLPANLINTFLLQYTNQYLILKQIQKIKDFECISDAVDFMGWWTRQHYCSTHRRKANSLYCSKFLRVSKYFASCFVVLLSFLDDPSQL